MGHGLFDRITLRETIDEAAFIEPTQDSVVDKVFHLEFLDARIAQFHQPLNVAETFDRRKRPAFDAVDMTNFASVSSCLNDLNGSNYSNDLNGASEVISETARGENSPLPSHRRQRPTDARK